MEISRPVQKKMYKLGGLDKIQNDLCYFANVETLACVGVDASDGNE